MLGAVLLQSSGAVVLTARKEIEFLRQRVSFLGTLHFQLIATCCGVEFWMLERLLYVKVDLINVHISIELYMYVVSWRRLRLFYHLCKTGKLFSKKATFPFKYHGNSQSIQKKSSTGTSKKPTSSSMPMEW